MCSIESDAKIWTFVYFQELMETAMEFMKLEKIEFGGIKGKMLSAQVVQIFEEFNELYKVFTERSYDSLDPLDEVNLAIILTGYAIITARKRSLRRSCFYTCLSVILFTGGVPGQVPPQAGTPRQVHSQAGTPPPGAVPAGRYGQ